MLRRLAEAILSKLIERCTERLVGGVERAIDDARRPVYAPEVTLWCACGERLERRGPELQCARGCGRK